MNPAGESILAALGQVAAERQARLQRPGMVSWVTAVKEFQHRRFAQTYADLLAQPRYAQAVRFFLEELYGPHDFSLRDKQFARVVPALVRLFPREIVATVDELARLHALSERLDSAMALVLASDKLDDNGYAGAWRAVGEPALREEQIALTASVGQALDRYTRRALLRNTLRMLRGPAQAAGLSALQHFLETGFETFKALGGAAEFLATVGERERALAARLFAGGGLV